MADWVTVGVSVLTSIGISGGLIGAAGKAFFDRNEGQHVWERDHVTERYTATRQALLQLAAVFAQEVETALQQRPVPDLDRGFRALDDAYGQMIAAMSDTSVIARDRVSLLLPAATGIEYQTLAPVTRAIGIPKIATDRFTEELRFISSLLQILLLAMRVDLGLTPRKKRKIADTRISEFLQYSKLSRSCFVNVPDAMAYRNMYLYQVQCLGGWNNSYRVSSDFFDEYCAESFAPELLARKIEAILIADPHRNLFAAIRGDGVSTSRAVVRLRQIGCTVESGCRVAPGADGWRDMQDGSKAWVWTADSNLDFALK